MRKEFDSSSAAQRARLLERLQKGSCSTVQARHELDILGVAPRIYELRHHYGFNIKMHWTKGDNPGGGSHWIAQYVLHSGKYQEGN